MLDASSYLAGEIRNLAFRKAAEHATWQDATRQQAAENENRLCKVSKNNLLVDFSSALLHLFIHSKRGASASHTDRVQAQQQSAALAANLPSHPKAG